MLDRGELFGIFPEGTRSRDGYLYKGRTGVARLAMKVGCPIYPVGVTGTDKIQPPDAKLPKLRKECTIKIGRPIKMDRYRDRADDRLVLRQITDEVMFEIRELTGQEYRNVYAGKTSDTEDVRAGQVEHVGEGRHRRGVGGATPRADAHVAGHGAGAQAHGAAGHLGRRHRALRQRGAAAQRGDVRHDADARRQPDGDVARHRLEPMSSPSQRLQADVARGGADLDLAADVFGVDVARRRRGRSWPVTAPDADVAGRAGRDQPRRPSGCARRPMRCAPPTRPRRLDGDRRRRASAGAARRARRACVTSAVATLIARSVRAGTTSDTLALPPRASQPDGARTVMVLPS